MDSLLNLVEKYSTMISSLAAIVATIAAIAGGLFALCKWNKSLKNKRAEFIKQIFDRLKFDKDLIEAMRIIQNSDIWYDDTFHNSNNEAKIDNFLTSLNYFCYLEDTKNISKKEFKMFQYEIESVYINTSVKAYLWNLFHYSKKVNIACFCEYLIDYGIKNKKIKKEFKEYEKHLYVKNSYFRYLDSINDLEKLLSGVIFEESNSEFDSSGYIDYVAKVGSKALGIHIKLIIEKASIEDYSEKEKKKMEDSFANFEDKFGGKVFIISSLDGKIENQEVIEKIKKEIERLKNTVC